MALVLAEFEFFFFGGWGGGDEKSLVGAREGGMDRGGRKGNTHTWVV